MAPPKKILIVEDEEVIRRLCRRLLVDAGWEISIEETIRGALDFLAANRPDLLITDLRLPDGNGVQVIKAAREREPGLPVIVITGSPSPDDRLAPLPDLSGVECLMKPFQAKELKDAVKKSLKE